MLMNTAFRFMKEIIYEDEESNDPQCTMHPSGCVLLCACRASPMFSI